MNYKRSKKDISIKIPFTSKLLTLNVVLFPRLVKTGFKIWIPSRVDFTT